jgi:hypothetical protein
LEHAILIPRHSSEEISSLHILKESKFEGIEILKKESKRLNQGSTRMKKIHGKIHND